MAKKTLKKKVMKKKVQAKSASSNIAAPVVDSAREIWLAGLGAYSVAQAEGGKLIEQGTKLFDKLVSEGSKLEKMTRNVTDTAVSDIKGGVESTVDAVRKQATDNWDKLENIFEDRVARVLGTLGVPTADDVNKLSARVQKLSRQVTTLAKASSPKASPAKATKPRKAAARKKVTKKVSKK